MPAIIILAAGESSRLGKPKQNLVFENKTLLQRAVETAMRSKYRPVVIVLGAVDIPLPEIINEQIRIIYNEEWKEGIASSIRAGVQEIANTTADAVLIMLYNNTIGVPALFNQSLFGELLLLTGDEGARKIIKDYHGYTGIIQFEPGAVDIDTEADYRLLLDMKSGGMDLKKGSF